MKVLFLDIDGVLNHEATFLALDRNDMIAPECVKRLFALIERTGAKIVLSSSWRGIPDLEERLERAGVMAHVISRTPKLSGDAYKCRGSEIEDWLNSNPSPPTHYAIVDDDSDMLPGQLSNFVQTDFRKGGLLDEHCERIAAILAPPTVTAAN